MSGLNLLAKLTGNANNVLYTCELPPVMAEIRRLERDSWNLLNSPGYHTEGGAWMFHAVQRNRARINELRKN